MKTKHDKYGKGMVVFPKNRRRYTRKASAEQTSTKVRAHQACVADLMKGKKFNSRDGVKKNFSEANKTCKRLLDVEI